MYLASVSNELRLYDTENWSQVFNHGAYDSVIHNVEWSDGGKYFLQVNPSGRVEIYSATHDGVRCLQCIPDQDTSAATFHSGGHREVALGCKSGKIYIWDTKRKAINKTFTEAAAAVKFIDFNCKNTFLAAGLENGDITIYGVTTNYQVGIINIPSCHKESAVKLNKVSALKFHHDLRSILALASDEGCVLVRDLGNGKNKLFMKDAHKSIVSGIAFSKVNDDVMLSCGFDRKMHIYDVRKAIIVTTVTTDYALTSVDISANNYVALGTTKGQVLVYDLRKVLQPVFIMNDHNNIVNKVAFQPEVDKRKRYMALDASLKESFSPKLSTPNTLKPGNCKTPEGIKSYEYIDQFNSPIYELPSPKREKLDTTTNASRDSFLVNIVGTEIDLNRNSPMIVDSPEANNNSQRASDIISQRLFRNRMRKSTSLGEKLSDCGTSASTPIIARMSAISEATPSPIPCLTGKGDGQQDSNDNFSPKEMNTIEKKGDSVDSVSAVETVKCSSNLMVELGNEIKDFITYSIFDVLEQSKSNFMQITIQQTKNRLYLEDQIALLAQRVQDLQFNQSKLIEENKKLSIEIELLRSNRN